MPTLAYTMETILDPNPDFPTGYSQDAYRPCFDFGRNWFYIGINGGGQGGISVTDLSTMHVTQTPTLTQMFAGTAFGPTPGVPYSQDVRDIVAGRNSDIYLTHGPDIYHEHLIRVDPITMKVTGDFYGPGVPGVAGMAGMDGVLNKTATHTILVYTTPVSNGGPLIYDGTGMSFIGFGPLPAYANGNNTMVVPGLTNPDGSCDFWMVNCDIFGTSGNIDIWRIRVTDGLVLTFTKTGTANILPYFAVGTGYPYLRAGCVDYDYTHDCLVLQLSNANIGAPMWVASVESNGTINWMQGPNDTITSGPYAMGQSQLTEDTLMFGGSTELTMLNTATGEITYTGAIIVQGSSAGSFFRVWDASRDSYWTYALSRGFARIDFIPDPAATLTDAELFFRPGASFVDLSVESNRRLFIAAGGTPQWMDQRDGSLPFGEPPAVYLTTLGRPRDFTQNNGNGGAFPLAPGTIIDPAPGPGCTFYYVTESAGSAADPMWRLSVSDDGSRTWSRLVKPRSMGPVGHYKTRLRWLKMGQFRQRVMKLESTDPVRKNIIGIYIDLEQGMQ